MKTLIKYLCIYLMALSSCEKDANINIPDYKPKLVLNSIISPSDTALYANIGATRNLYASYVNSERHSFESLKVMLLDGDSAFQFARFDTIGLQFKLKHKVYPGREYKIIATCEGFADISAKCKIPAYKQIKISADTAISADGSGCGIIQFRDNSDEISYYMVSAYESLHFNESIYPFLQKCQLLNFDYKFHNSELYLDNQPSGKDYTTEFFCNGYYSLGNLKGLDITGIVFETDKNYYLYYSSLQKYKDPGNPFIEFSQVYSNVNGGYGIFACYNRYEKTVKIK